MLRADGLPQRGVVGRQSSVVESSVVGKPSERLTTDDQRLTLEVGHEWAGREQNKAPQTQRVTGRSFELPLGLPAANFTQ